MPITNFGDLVRFGLGERAAVTIEVLIVVYAFGACVSYLILLGDVLTPVVQKTFTSMSKNVVRTLVVCSCAVVCWAICLLRRISALKYSAAVAVLAVLFTVFMLIYDAFTDPCKVDLVQFERRNGVEVLVSVLRRAPSQPVQLRAAPTHIWCKHP